MNERAAVRAAWMRLRTCRGGVVGIGDLIAEVGVAEGEHGIFERSATAQAPILTGHFLDEALFVGALGLPGLFKLLTEDEEGLHVFVGEHVDGAIEAGAESVQAGDFLAFFGFGGRYCVAHFREWRRGELEIYP